jgi:prophage tail gpP-like protein
MADLQLVVAGKRYGGWKRIRVTRSIESVAGSFEVGANDRWAGQAQAWPIGEEDPCRVEIDREVVIDGYVDTRAISLSGSERSLTYSGRDRCAALVDCSAELEQWTFRRASVLDVASKIAEPFGIEVSLAAGVSLPAAPRKFVVSPGEDAWSAIERAARQAGVLVVADGRGGIQLTRSGTTRAAPLVEGENILAASVEYAAAERFSRYVVMTQTAGTDEASGGATRIRAEATDAAIRRTDRVLVIRPEAGVTTDYARRRADWEARLRAAKAEKVSITVLGWRQPGGELWPVNALARVTCPGIGVGGEMLISEVEHSISDAGELSTLRLIRPDALTPEPEAATVKSSGGRWKELTRGAL